MDLAANSSAATLLAAASTLREPGGAAQISGIRTGIGSSAGVGNEAVNLAEVLDDVVDELGNVVIVANVELVGLRLDAVGGGQILGVLLTSLGARRVGDGNVGAHLGATARGLNAHTSGPGGAGDDHDLALEAEEVLEGVGLGDVDRHGWRGVRVN
jgi:hypothetical protein